jgi:hypothetical protein
VEPVDGDDFWAGALSFFSPALSFFSAGALSFFSPALSYFSAGALSFFSPALFSDSLAFFRDSDG